MAKGLTENLVKFYDLEFVEIDYKEFDNLYIYDSEEYKIVVALKGKTVMELRYLGYEDINNIVESVANKINIISE